MRPPSDHGTRLAVPSTSWRPRLRSITANAVATGRAALGYVSFWTAVCLPVLIVGLLASGIETATEATILGSLLVLETVALLAGQAHLVEPHGR